MVRKKILLGGNLRQGDLSKGKIKGYSSERGKRAKKLHKTPRRGFVHHVLGPVGRTGGPKRKSFQGEKFEIGGFNIFQGKISISKGTAVRGEKERKNCTKPLGGVLCTTFRDL